jgi:hypothetical protein
VHHGEDRCIATPFGAATALPAALSSSAKVDFVEVKGGDPPRSEPCEAMAAHGYLGREPDVVAVIADWIDGKTGPEAGALAPRHRFAAHQVETIQHRLC